MTDSDNATPLPPAEDCCGPDRDPRIAAHFDSAIRGRVARGETPALHSVSRHLLDKLSDVTELQPSVLEIGCGSGAMTVSLLLSGAQQADGVDLSAQSLALARRRAEDAGVGGRATFALGDGARVQLTPHDWLVVDRVMCCYPDVERLLANAIPAARSRFAFSVPTSRGLLGVVNRLLMVIEGLYTKIQGRPCPGYVHSLDLIEARLRALGFSPLRSATHGLWYTAVFERSFAS